jgi:CheY-like chemotaxis protein
MPKGGKLSIQTSNVVIDTDSPKHKAQPAGSYIQLNVVDTGIGMDTETQERIFEPFFTTKPVGKGTGLGLATVYGIVKQSGGFIWVNSTKDVGTSFTIQFPRVQEPLVKQETEGESGDIPSGKETILLVEDEELIRRAAHELLNVLGYSVLVAENGLAALQVAQIFDKPIHLLLTDVVMPKMNGRELAEKMKEIHPETNVLFMSGYTDDIITRHGVLEEGTNFIEKPFAPSILAIKIREILESKNN